MGREKLITMTQATQVAALYNAGHTIKEIRKKKGVVSERSIYRILHNLKVDLRPKVVKGSAHIFYLEKDTIAIIDELPNGMRSIFVDDVIKFYSKNKP